MGGRRAGIDWGTLAYAGEGLLSFGVISSCLNGKIVRRHGGKKDGVGGWAESRTKRKEPPCI